jgi:hypothetical protein
MAVGQDRASPLGPVFYKTQWLGNHGVLLERFFLRTRATKVTDSKNDECEKPSQSFHDG